MLASLRARLSLRCPSRLYSVVGIDPVTESLSVPSSIILPSYHKNGIPPARPPSIDIKGETEIGKMREAGHITGGILDKVLSMAKEGVSTDELDKFTHSEIIAAGAYPAPLNYRAFPKSICTSVNNVLCHGIPNTRKLRSGDIISIDVSIYYKGVFGDCCSSVAVGEIDVAGHRLIAAAKQATLAAIDECGPGSRFNVIGNAIGKVAAEEGFTISKEFIGHGIGSYFHGFPEIYHYPNVTNRDVMRPGMVFTIEPILMEGRDAMVILSDGWTAVSADCKRSAQFEHTVLITRDGTEILSPHR